MRSATSKNLRRALTTQSKTFATNSVATPTDMGGYNEMIQPKVQLFGVHAQYANALYSVAAKQKTLEKVEKELHSIEQAIKTDESFHFFLKDPTIPRYSKQEDISRVMEQAKYSQPVAGLFEILAENGRLAESLGVITSYKKLMSAYRGEVQAKVISADPLSKPELDQVKKALGTRIEQGQTLVLETAVDPNIMGGLKVHIGNYFIDLSLATKIDKINSVLANTST
uniref:ATP synthase subunit O putative n=1 Tax=Albugo laibachii Nc14 TaxID=890382 RepID=F0WN89_9STRA|nr:ATP synthase subunit O putative [Albugo laibachii Nc14]|eukprot:CCA22778.1 ATP synthase subunit O putative [Albugo laibachii Nc14]